MTAGDLHALRAAGATLREIAKLTNLSVSRVHKRLQSESSTAASAQPVPEAAPALAGKVQPGRQKTITQRACMCCAKPFKSEGPHNRLCRACRTRDVSPFAPAL